jgi:hypothetical protein
MGSNYFKGQKAPQIGGGNMNLASRAFSAPQYAGRQAGLASQKDIATALALGNAQKVLKKSTGSSAYPAGPKV